MPSSGTYAGINDTSQYWHQLMMIPWSKLKRGMWSCTVSRLPEDCEGGKINVWSTTDRTITAAWCSVSESISGMAGWAIVKRRQAELSIPSRSAGTLVESSPRGTVPCILWKQSASGGWSTQTSLRRRHAEPLSSTPTWLHQWKYQWKRQSWLQLTQAMMYAVEGDINAWKPQARSVLHQTTSCTPVQVFVQLEASLTRGIIMILRNGETSTAVWWSTTLDEQIVAEIWIKWKTSSLWMTDVVHNTRITWLLQM